MFIIFFCTPSHETSQHPLYTSTLILLTFQSPLILVHSPTVFVYYSNFSADCCTWSGFFISFTHHSYCTSIISLFVTNDSSFILGLLCYFGLSPVCTGSLSKFCFCFFFGLCSCLPCTFDGWVPILDFYFQGFSSSKLFNAKYILIGKKVAIYCSHAL